MTAAARTGRTLTSAVLAATLAASLVPAAPARAVDAFDYCLDHREQCALSIHHVTDGWERHLNADRLQVTASTFKVLTLIVYAHAVVDGRLDPDRQVTKEEWARFWVGRDGGSLEAAWDRLGQPDQVSVDEIAGAMIRESDNAAPDWFLNELGSGYFKRVLKPLIDGYHDVPQSIGGSFLSWGGHPEERGIGPRMLAEYSGQDALGYGKEVATIFQRLRAADFAQASRDQVCTSPPWAAPPAGCSPDFGEGTEAGVRELLGNYFVQSNSRTYNRLLLGILDGSLLPALVQEVVSRHLEWPLAEPGAADGLTRAGGKGGSLAPQNICNWVGFAELEATGEQVVTSVFMRDTPVDTSCNQLEPWGILEALLGEVGFKDEVRRRLSEEVPLPELIARFEKIKRKARAAGDRLNAKVRVSNIGPADAAGPFEIWLVSSATERLRDGEVLEKWVVPTLAAGGSEVLKFKRNGLEGIAGSYLFLRVDRLDEIAEGNEDNDRPWQIVP